MSARDVRYAKAVQDVGEKAAALDRGELTPQSMFDAWRLLRLRNAELENQVEVLEGFQLVDTARGGTPGAPHGVDAEGMADAPAPNPAPRPVVETLELLGGLRIVIRGLGALVALQGCAELRSSSARDTVRRAMQIGEELADELEPLVDLARREAGGSA